MSLLEILFLLLLLLALGFTAFAVHRWWKFKKMLSYTKEMIGKRVEDLLVIPKKGQGVQIPLNIPKKGTVIFFFTGPNCKLCPKQEEELKKFKKGFKLYKLDIRTKEGKKFAALFRVLVLPTVVVVKDRTIVGYFTTFAPEKKIKEALSRS